MNITMTKAEALKKQAEQVAYYSKLYPDIPVSDIIARNTHPELLYDGIEYNMVTINHVIPRGAKIEMLIGKFNPGYD